MEVGARSLFGWRVGRLFLCSAGGPNRIRRGYPPNRPFGLERAFGFENCCDIAAGKHVSAAGGGGRNSPPPPAGLYTTTSTPQSTTRPAPPPTAESPPRRHARCTPGAQRPP